MQVTPRIDPSPQVEAPSIQRHVTPLPTLTAEPAPPPTARRRVPTWVTVVSMIVAVLAIAAAIGLYMVSGTTSGDRDAAIRRADAAEVQVSQLQDDLSSMDARVAGLEGANTDLNAKVDACQSMMKTSVLMFTGETAMNGANSAQLMADVTRCYGSFPTWLK